MSQGPPAGAQRGERGQRLEGDRGGARRGEDRQLTVGGGDRSQAAGGIGEGQPSLVYAVSAVAKLLRTKHRC